MSSWFESRQGVFLISSDCNDATYHIPIAHKFHQLKKQISKYNLNKTPKKMQTQSSIPIPTSTSIPATKYFSYNLIIKFNTVESITIEIDQQDGDDRENCFGSGTGSRSMSRRGDRWDWREEEYAVGTVVVGVGDRQEEGSVRGTARRSAYDRQDQLSHFRTQIHHPKILFLLTHAQSLTLPNHKPTKSTLSSLLSSLSIPTTWKKGPTYYKAHLHHNPTQTNHPKIICLNDVRRIQEEFGDGVVGGIVGGNGGIGGNGKWGDFGKFREGVRRIKREVAYWGCVDLWVGRFMGGLLHTEDDRIRIQYQKYMKIIQSIYTRASSSSFQQDIPQPHPTNPNPNPNLQTQPSQQHSLKNLKQHICQLVTSQQIINPTTTTTTNTTTTTTTTPELDQQCKQFVYETIRQLFVSQYEHVVSQYGAIQRPNIQVYQKVVEQMGKHMQLDYKSLFLISILLQHMQQPPKILQISHININQQTPITINQSSQNLDLLLTFQKSSMDQLLISQSSLSLGLGVKDGKVEDGGDKEREKEREKELRELRERVGELESYVGVLEDQLRRNGVNGIKEKARIVCQQVKQSNNDFKYLENKIEELKRQSISSKKNPALAPSTKHNQNTKSSETLKHLISPHNSHNPVHLHNPLKQTQTMPSKQPHKKTPTQPNKSLPRQSTPTHKDTQWRI